MKFNVKNDANCFHADSNVLWGLHQSEQDDVCTLYFLCA